LICVFPDPYPDELLYSVCARYKDLMRYPNNAIATYDFFGSETASAVIDLPNRLEHLVAALPPGHLYTADEFIDDHTMFPFYGPFLSHERAGLVRNEMRSSGENRVRSRVGAISSDLARTSYLRFCPVCVEEDRQCFGETYWHRVHQIPGIEVCPHHSVFLESKKAPFNNTRYPREALSAESSVHITSGRPLNLSHSPDKILLKIARSAAWLLTSRLEALGDETLRTRYYNSLLRHGLAYYNKKIRTNALVSKFIECYSQEMLRGLGCDIKKSNHLWLLRLLHASKTGILQHPLRHILLIVFLGYTTEEFFTSFEEYKPFGGGPWPCLNHPASHYRKLTIKECRITDGQKSDRAPIGIFECTCGFIYTRTGPQKTRGDFFRATSVRAYGVVWETALRKLWQDTSVTLREVAIKLGVTELTVKRWAIYLGLPHPRNTPRSLRASGKVLDRYRILRKPPQEEIEKHRQEWSAVIRANPRVGRSELRVIASSLMSQLRRTDSEWLEANMPTRRKSPPPIKRVNWKKVEVKLAAEVKVAALRVRSITDPPVRISLASIINEVGHRPHIERRLSKLPLTARTLDDYIESHENFLIRKSQWVAETYRKEGVKPSRSQFAKRVGAHKRQAAKNERVQKAVDTALATLV